MAFLFDKQFIAITLLLSAAVVSGWFALQGRSRETAQTLPKEPMPNLILKKVVITEMNEQGRPHHRLYAENMNIFRKQHRTTVTKPHLVLLDSNSQWYVQAEEGEMTEKEEDIKEEVHLQGQVKLTYLNTSNQKKTILETETLTFWPEERVLKTNDRVTLRQGTYHLQAQGLHADLKTKRVNFLSNIRGSYDVSAK